MSDLRQREAPPAGRGQGRSDQVGAGSVPSLAAIADAGADDTFPTLAAMTPRARSIALAYFEAGRAEGIAAGVVIGRREIEDREAAEWAALTAEVMPRLRAAIPFATACERRGDPVRAARQVALLREHQVTQ